MFLWLSNHLFEKIETVLKNLNFSNFIGIKSYLIFMSCFAIFPILEYLSILR